MQGKTVGYFDPAAPLFQLKLRGPPVGEPTIGRDFVGSISFQWPEEEKRKWEVFERERRGEMMEGVEGAEGVDDAEEDTSLEDRANGYSGEEKAFIKKHFKSEYKFLLTHGLNIYKDEDREEGQAILRALMQNSYTEDEA